MKKNAVVFALFFVVAFGWAETLMKITTDGSIDEISLGRISSMVFSDQNLVLSNGTTFTGVKKIEFIEETGLLPKNSKNGTDLGISYNERQLVLTGVANQKLAVYLYAMNGRQVATLHNDIVSANELTIGDGLRNIAPGVYSLVVSQGKSLFVQKLLVK